MVHDLIAIGSGLGSLSAAAMLSKNGLEPLILEQNRTPGDCTTSYPRKGFIWEAGERRQKSILAVRSAGSGKKAYPLSPIVWKAPPL